MPKHSAGALSTMGASTGAPSLGRRGNWYPRFRARAVIAGVVVMTGVGWGTSADALRAPASAAAGEVAAAPADDPTVIPGEYIVVLNEGLRAQGGGSEIERLNNQIGSVLDEVGQQVGNSVIAQSREVEAYKLIWGFSATLSDDEVAALEANDSVDFVEPNRVVTAFPFVGDDLTATTTTAAPPSWGLDRINQRRLPLDQNARTTGNGKGVHVYVVDSGVDVHHNEFAGRVGRGYVAPDACATSGTHGTHVAGTATGATVGVATAATVHNVAVLDCSGDGTSNMVIAGLEWIGDNGARPAVVNMSLGGGPSGALDLAVLQLIGKGLTVVAAAGNSNVDACGGSPGRLPGAITVASSADDDSRSQFQGPLGSNFGSCVDLFAPGSSIYSTLPGQGYGVISGTSMAAPHVAGAAALVLQAHRNYSPAQVWNAIDRTTTRNVISDPRSPNKLLFVRYVLKCAGLKPTIVGTPGDDVLRGTNGKDVIVGLGGKDVIYGRAGDDVVCGGGGNDKIWDGGGNDKLIGNGGNDTLNGGDGNDSLNGGPGNDIFYGREGNDKLIGGPGHDKLFGQEGKDRIKGLGGNDVIYGGGQADKLYGGTGLDKIWGGDGGDQILGGSADDRLDGGDGNDFISGEPGNDKIWGQKGSDEMWGGQGNDQMWGHGGNDSFLGGDGDDVMYGMSGNDSINGLLGRDTAYGGGGADRCVAEVKPAGCEN